MHLHIHSASLVVSYTTQILCLPTLLPLLPCVAHSPFFRAAQLIKAHDRTSLSLYLSLWPHSLPCSQPLPLLSGLVTPLAFLVPWVSLTLSPQQRSPSTPIRWTPSISACCLLGGTIPLGGMLCLCLCVGCLPPLHRAGLCCLTHQRIPVPSTGPGLLLARHSQNLTVA